MLEVSIRSIVSPGVLLVSAAISSVLKNGRPDRGMPAFPALDAHQVGDLIAFLRARSREMKGGLTEVALLVSSLFGDSKVKSVFARPINAG